MRRVLAVFCGFGVAFSVLTAPAATADPVADALSRDLGISVSRLALDLLSKLGRTLFLLVCRFLTPDVGSALLPAG